MIAVDVDKLKGEIADLKATIQTPSWDYVTGYISALSVVEGMIATLPTLTLDDLRPKGRWIDTEDGETVCSNCNTRIPEMYSNADTVLPSECCFCHRCGVKMAGGDTR